jgi:hypothetical protein
MIMTTRKNYDTEMEYVKGIPENIISTPPSNVTIILTLPQRPGGEMYGM